MGGIWSFFEGALNKFTIPYWLIHYIDNILNGFRASKLYRFKHPGHENWALITGASDGIGEGFAHELAERGFHVILHGRNHEKLRKKESLLKDAYPNVKTRVWVADATQDISKESLMEAVKGIHLTLLINNVGGLPSGVDSYALLEDQTFSQIERTIHMNIGFTTKLESALLPILCENQPSCIVNISSLASLGTPLISVYAATKGYLNVHSASLQGELWARGKDVLVHAILVGKVNSNSFSGDQSFVTPDSRTMAKATLDNLGLGRIVMTPYLPHLLQSSTFSLVPQFMAWRLMRDAIVASMKEDQEGKIKKS